MEGPIGWLSVDEYADRKELDEEQRDDLHYFIARMDKVYLDFRSKKLQSKPPAKPKGSPPVRKKR